MKKISSSITFRNRNILPKMIDNTKRFALLLVFTLFINFSSASYHVKGPLEPLAASSEVDLQQTITGNVVDDTGVPLPGATVLEKGTSNGTQTDFDGNFSIAVSDPNAILVISYIGFESQEIAINGQTTINVMLQASASALDEVVVVGYGTKTKREITGAISTISEGVITEQTVTGFDQSMVGRVAGVQVSQRSGSPGGSTNIRIRGIGTPGNNEPLYVIDGVPVFNNNQGRQSGTQPSGVLNTLNPNDIESIEVRPTDPDETLPFL